MTDRRQTPRNKRSDLWAYSSAVGPKISHVNGLLQLSNSAQVTKMNTL